MEENSKLLYIDICGRQPYGLKGRSYDGETVTMVKANGGGDSVIATNREGRTCVCGFVPYLRPMSDMSDEELEELGNRLRSIDIPPFGDIKDFTRLTSRQCFVVTAYLDEHMFDWRVNKKGKSLTELGLALVAPKGMYK